MGQEGSEQRASGGENWRKIASCPEYFDEEQFSK